MVWNRIAQLVSIDPLEDRRDVRHEDGGLAQIADIKDGKHARLWCAVTSYVEPMTDDPEATDGFRYMSNAELRAAGWTQDADGDWQLPERAHPEIERMLGKRVRVTIDVEEDEVDPNDPEQQRRTRLAQLLRDTGFAEAAFTLATMKPDIRATLIGRCVMEAEESGRSGLYRHPQRSSFHDELREGWQALVAFLKQPSPAEVAAFNSKEV